MSQHQQQQADESAIDKELGLEAHQFEVISLKTLFNNPIHITSKEHKKVFVVDMEDVQHNLDLVDEASKSSEYTKYMAESNKRSSIGMKVSQKQQTFGSKTNSVFTMISATR